MYMYRCTACHKIITDKQVSMHTEKHIDEIKPNAEAGIKSLGKYVQPVKFAVSDLWINPKWVIKKLLKKW